MEMLILKKKREQIAEDLLNQAVRRKVPRPHVHATSRPKQAKKGFTETY